MSDLYCRDCKYKSIDYMHRDICEHPKNMKINLVRGYEFPIVDIYKLREDDLYCGEMARWFERKNEPAKSWLTRLRENWELE